MTQISGLFAQTAFQGGDYWSFNAGFGMTDILVEGLSYQFIIDPKVSISPPLMLGSRLGINYSTDEILTFENQFYLRWNFFRPTQNVNVFAQSGVGLLALYKKGEEGFFGDPSLRRGSFMLDAAVGITIPLSSAWHIEPSIHCGYPHIAGFSVTMGSKIPFKKEQYRYAAEGKIITFGADTRKYNEELDYATQKHNDKVLNEIAKTLKRNPNYRVRIEGHANPVLNNPEEEYRLVTLSRMRSEEIAGKLRAKGVSEKQMVILAFGGSRLVTIDQNNAEKNRRVELIIFKDI